MEEDFYGDGSADSFISDRHRLMIMKDEARKKDKILNNKTERFQSGIYYIARLTSKS